MLGGFSAQFDGTRQLRVQFGEKEAFLVIASSQSGNVNKESKTWNFIDPVDNRHYRVQIQELK
jgi:hypothetical protein